MAFGFPARHTEHYVSGVAGEDLFDAVARTLHVLGWSERDAGPDWVLASTSMNLRSWGEKFVVEFRPDGSLDVTSKCAMPTQCIDWGKNKSNVRKFLEELERQG